MNFYPPIKGKKLNKPFGVSASALLAERVARALFESPSTLPGITSCYMYTGEEFRREFELIEDRLYDKNFQEVDKIIRRCNGSLDGAADVRFIGFYHATPMNKYGLLYSHATLNEICYQFLVVNEDFSAIVPKDSTSKKRPLMPIFDTLKKHFDMFYNRPNRPLSDLAQVFWDAQGGLLSAAGVTKIYAGTKEEVDYPTTFEFCIPGTFSKEQFAGVNDVVTEFFDFLNKKVLTSDNVDVSFVGSRWSRKVESTGFLYLISAQDAEPCYLFFMVKPGKKASDEYNVPYPDDERMFFPDVGDRSKNAPVYLLSAEAVFKTASAVYGRNIHVRELDETTLAALSLKAQSEGWDEVRIYGKQLLLIAKL